MLALDINSSFVFAILAVLAHGIWTYLSLPLTHIPGPAYTNYSIIPLLSWIFTGKSWRQYGALCERYGPLVRIAPNALVTGSADQWRKMHAPRSPYVRADWYEAMKFKPGVNNIGSTRDEKMHASLRMKMASGYSGKENPDLEATIDTQVLQFVKLIESKYLSDPRSGVFRPMDLAKTSHYFTLDVISSLAFGQSFNDLRDDNDNFGYIKEVSEGFVPIMILAELPKFFAFLEKSSITKLLSSGDSLGLGKACKMATTLVDARFGGPRTAKTTGNEKYTESHMDMMQSFLRHGLTREQVESETVLQIMAGSDTTATSVRMVFLHVLSNPTIYEKLMREVSSFAVDEGVISDATARSMKYLQACIKEALRLAPPISGLLYKEVPEGGDTIEGYFVPGGTKIGWSTYAITREAKLFGPDPDCYRPERWILVEDGGDCSDEEQLLAQERQNELVFGYGRFKCLGQVVALMEMNKVIVELLKRFEWKFCDNRRPLKEEFVVGLWLQSGMFVQVTRRVT